MKPMLAATILETSKLNYPLMVSPKLDGVRAIVTGGEVLSRNLKPIPNQYVQELFGLTELEGTDGELIVGEVNAPQVFHSTFSHVSSQKDCRKTVRYYVFDLQTYGDTKYEARYNDLPKLRAKGVVLVKQAIVQSEQELLSWEQYYLKLGYEGIMVRSLKGLYKEGRSTLKEGYLMKLKRFVDSEAIITGYTELMHNENPREPDKLGGLSRSKRKSGMVRAGLLGALQVYDAKTKVEFELGTGFSQKDREDLWKTRKSLKGRMVKYKYQPIGIKEKPRFPVFLGFRDLFDLS